MMVSLRRGATAPAIAGEEAAPPAAPNARSSSGVSTGPSKKTLIIEASTSAKTGCTAPTTTEATAPTAA